MQYGIASFLALVAPVLAQEDVSLTDSLLSKLAEREDATLFSTVLIQFPTLIHQIIDEAKGHSDEFLADGVTVLVPNDMAVAAYLADQGVELNSLEESVVKSTLSYHIMVKPMKGEELVEPRGLTIPTLLDGEDELGISFNLRAPAPQIQADYGTQATGQVLFTKPDEIDGEVHVRILTKRQDSGETTQQLSLRGGEAQTAQMSLVDGEWEGGLYQIVDQVLAPPVPCSNTIRGLADNLESLDVALNRTDLWPALNNHPNVSCLAPSDQAFSDAGNPEENLDEEDLRQALLDHTLEGPAYSNYLEDGMVMQTLSNKTVTVSVNDTGVFFNDARVVQSNVLTNNGLVHVLDKVMVVSNDATKDSEDDEKVEPAITDGDSAAESLRRDGLFISFAVVGAAFLLV